MKRILAMFGTLLGLAAMWTAPRHAAAQPAGSDKAAAEALFQQAQQLLAQGQTEQACRKLAASQQLDPAVGTLLYLGDCYEKQGKLASAWASFEEAESLAKREGQPRRQKIAEVRSAALEPQLPRLVVRVAEAHQLEGLVVRRDGVPVSQPSWGAALPLDPGSHEIAATAPGRQPWSRMVELRAAETVTVEIPMLQATAAEPTPATTPAATEATPRAAPAGASAPPTSTGDEALADDGTGTAVQVAGGIATGAGVLGLVLGTAFGLLADASNDESLEQCRTPTLCSPEGLELREEARDQALVSTIGFAAGGALLVGGVLALVLAPSGPDGALADGPSLGAAVGPDQAAVILQGRW